MRFLTKLAAIAAFAGLAACATTPAPTQAEIEAYDYGPRPTNEVFWSMAEQEVRERLRDPESARFKRGNAIRRGYWPQFFGEPIWGYYACGQVNSKNGFGGYVGDTYYLYVWMRGQTRYIQIDDADGGIVGMQCQQNGF